MDTEKQDNEIESPEELFFKLLFFVATHLIKNANSMSQVLVPLIDSYEKKTWQTLPNAKKKEILGALSNAVGDNGLIGKHFAEYPHQYTKKKFTEFRSAMAKYLSTLD